MPTDKEVEAGANWREGLTHKDWLFDGSEIRAGSYLEQRFNRLDWSRAYLDMGPSPAGNLGPYWHVPLVEDDDETVHRLYPKVLQGKWLNMIRHACEEWADNRERHRAALSAAEKVRGASPVTAENHRSLPPEYTEPEKAELRRQLRDGNKEAREIVQRRGVTMHPRIRELKARAHEK